MRWFKFNISLHKWLSLVVGIQLLIWIGTGLYFNLMDHKKASGNTQRVHVEHEVGVLDSRFFPLSDLQTQAPIEVDLLWILNRPYYQLVYEKGEHSYQVRRSQLFDAISGAPFTLNKNQALTIARRSYSGMGVLSEARFLQPPFSDDVKQQNPLWQIKANDKYNTVIYLDGVNGRVARHVTDDVRLKDLMMKLHFMDYFNTGGFNHWLIIVFALGTLILSVTGVTWLIKQWQSGQITARSLFRIG